MSRQHFFHQRRETQASDIVSRTWARRIALAAAAVLFVMPGTAQAQSFWNWGPSDYSEQRPAPQKRAKVKRKVDPAEKIAKNAPKPVGPLVIAVSIASQRVKVYDSNGLFAEAPVSTGTKTHPTPMGVFSVIQKNKHHVSNLYGAAMPYMQRITWSGVALHTGPLPGYAASHGCIRLPNEFAARLWTWTKMGTRVIVAPGDISPSDIAHPKLIARTTPPQAASASLPATKIAAQTETPVAPAKLAPRRTADAADTIASMKGTLSDADPSPAAKEAVSPAEIEVEEKAAKIIAETPAAIAQESRPASANSAAATEVAPSEATASSSSEAKTAEQAQQQPAAEKSAQAETPAPRPAEIASPEAKPAETAKPDIAAPVAAPEAAKPTVSAAAPKRGQTHVAVFISRKDQKLYVRQGYEPVFDVPVQIADVERPLGTHIFTARGSNDDQTALQWSVVSLPQVVRRNERNARQKTKGAAAVQSSITPALNASEALDRVSIPTEALEKIAAIIAPGGSLLISDHGLNGWETGKGTDFIVPLR